MEISVIAHTLMLMTVVTYAKVLILGMITGANLDLVLGSLRATFLNALQV